MPKPKNRLPGHSLANEGWPHDEHGQPIGTYRGGPGRALCSCTEVSDVRPSAYSRKQWHRAHKVAKRDA